MQAIPHIWIILVAGALVAGASLVGILVVRRHAEALAALVGLLAFVASAVSLVAIADSYGRVDAVLYAFGFMAAAIAGGWALAASLLERLVHVPPSLHVPSELPDDSGSTAVVIVACVEPSEYSPRATAGMLQALVDEGLLKSSMASLPFLFFAQKTRYRAIGGTSPACGQLSSLAEGLEASLAGTSVALVDYATCSGPRRLASRVLSAVERGHRHVIVVELAVGDSLHLDEAKRETDSLRLEDSGVRVTYTESLESADRVVNMLVQRIVIAADEPEATGVVLVGHGQPEERARRNPAFDEQESTFLNRVRARLINAGIPADNVRLAWAEWRSPTVTSTVRHLAALGARRVAVVPGVFPLDNIAIRLELELAVRQARVDESVIVVTLPAWRDDLRVLSEIAERVHTQLAENPEDA